MQCNGLFVIEQQTDRPQTQTGCRFLKKISRFAKHTAEELQQLQKKQNAKNTDRSTKVGLTPLHKYFSAVGIDKRAEEMSPDELNNNLIPFYANARTTKGEYYKLNSMRSFRSSIQRKNVE